MVSWQEHLWILAIDYLMLKVLVSDYSLMHGLEQKGKVVMSMCRVLRFLYN